ncbi:MAG: hypothetical protein KAW12_12335 [Candidatus Aminicenantes bacterium]|nr:hypothetical protein [Candidatus Aminicenantes bacterium]
MKTRIILVLVFLVFVIGSCRVKPETVPTWEGKGIALYMNDHKGKMTTVLGKQRSALVLKDNKNTGKIEKIFYKNKDYSPYVKDLLDTTPVVFVSVGIVIFSKEKATIKNGECSCSEAIVFIPEETKIFFIEAKGLIFNERNGVLICSYAVMRTIYIDDEGG